MRVVAEERSTAIAGSQTFEITSLRRDVETDGRRAVIAFTDDWAEDAARRDFTINALYASAGGKIFDYATGVEDLIAGPDLPAFLGELDRVAEQIDQNLLQTTMVGMQEGRDLIIGA